MTSPKVPDTEPAATVPRTRAATMVLVATPLVGRDAELVADWKACIDAVAEAFPGFAFVPLAAVRAGDDAAAAVCACAQVRTTGVPRYALEEGGSGGSPGPAARGSLKNNKVSIMYSRLEIVRAALALGASVIWFLNVDVRVGPPHWAAIDGVFRSGRGVAVVPYPLRRAPGRAPAVWVCPEGEAPELADARLMRSSEGATAATILGGGMGCTAALTPVVAAVSFIVHEYVLATSSAGEDVGWFVNARTAGVEVRMPLGVWAERVGVEPDPVPDLSGL